MNSIKIATVNSIKIAEYPATASAEIVACVTAIKKIGLRAIKHPRGVGSSRVSGYGRHDAPLAEAQRIAVYAAVPGRSRRSLTRAEIAAAKAVARKLR